MVCSAAEPGPGKQLQRTTREREQREGQPEHVRVFAGRFRATGVFRREAGFELLIGVDQEKQQPVLICAAPPHGMSFSARLRLEHEAKLLRELACPYVPDVLHFAQEDGAPFLVMSWPAGITLEARLRHGPLPLPDALAVGRSILLALHASHERGLLHRDVKPSNVFVPPGSPVARAILFGFRLEGGQDAEEGIQHELHDAAYRSPEQAGLLRRDVDHRSDLYSAGIILYQCVAGRTPFRAPVLSDLLLQHLNARPASLLGLGVGAPAALDDVLQRLLRKDPSHRYQSAAAAAADLEGIARALEQGERDPRIVVGLFDRRSSLTNPAFIGRKSELAALGRELDRAFTGDGGLVLVEGENGMGKSRLLDELAQECARRSALVLRASAAVNGQEPLGPLDEIASALQKAGIDGKATEALRLRLGPHARGVAELFPQLGPLFSKSAIDQVALDPLAALCALLDALGTAERPAVLLIDDAHAADDQTLRLLDRWQEEKGAGARHTLLVASYCGDDTPEAHALRKLSPRALVSLRPLRPPELRGLLQSMAGALPEEAIAVAERLSAGNAFLATAAVQGMVEAGALVEVADGFRVVPEIMARVQASGQAADLLAMRLDLLPDDALALLAAAAVQGPAFDLEAAVELAGQTPHRAAAVLDQATRRHILWSRGPGGGWAFVHEGLRDAILARLSPEDRRELHRALAERLERRDGSAFALAFHFDAAGMPERALPHALVAAARARAASALDDAEEQYRIALRSVKPTDQARRREVALSLGQVLAARGRPAEAREQLEGALALVSNEGDRAGTLLDLAELLLEMGEGAAAAAATRRALEAAQGLPGEPALCRRAVIAAWLSLGAAAAAKLHLKAVQEGVTPLDSFHAALLFQPAWLQGAEARAREAEEALMRAPLEARAPLHAARGLALLGLCRLEDAVDELGKAEELFSRAGRRCEAAIANLARLEALLHKGDLGQVREECRRAQEQAPGFAVVDAYLWLRSRATQGDLPASATAGALERSRQTPVVLLAVLQGEALRLFRAGAPAQALRLVREAEALVARTGPMLWTASLPSLRVRGLREQAELLAPRLPRRRALLRKAESAAQRAVALALSSAPHALPQALREAALTACAAGKIEKARERLDRAAAAAATQGAGHELELARLQRGRLGVVLGWPGAQVEAAEAALALARLGVSGPEEHALPAPARPRVTLSLLDRFEALIAAGRRLAGSLERDAIFAALRTGAQALLRCDRYWLLPVKQGAPVLPSSELDQTAAQLARQAIARGVPQAGPARPGAPRGDVGSLLCAPIFLRGQAAQVFCVRAEVEGLFGPEEERLALFLASVAGAALESAEGFARSEALSASLHERAEELQRTLGELQSANYELLYQKALHDAQNAASIEGVLVTADDGRVLFANRRFSELWSLPIGLPERVDEQRALDVLGQLEDPDATLARVRALISSPARAIEELALRDGRTFECYAAPVTGTDGTSFGRAWFVRDVSERRRAEEEIRILRSNEIRVQEEERRRLAHALHDGAGQALLGLALQMADVEREEKDATLRERLARLRGMVESLLQDLRRLSHDLRPATLDLGLSEALRDLSLKMTAGKLEVQFVEDPRGAPSPAPAIAVQLYRVAQAALANVARHAHATIAQVRLSRDEHGLSLEIEDDGQGFDAKRMKDPGLGLLGMRERAAWLGGTFELETEPGKGTRIAVHLTGA